MGRPSVSRITYWPAQVAVRLASTLPAPATRPAVAACPAMALISPVLMLLVSGSSRGLNWLVAVVMAEAAGLLPRLVMATRVLPVVADWLPP